MALPQYGNQEPQHVIHVYYAGTDELEEGQHLCFEPLDDASVNAPGAADTDKGTWLGNRVNNPDAANLATYAGIVSPSSAGVTGPQWIDVVVPKPGEFHQILIDGTTDVAVDDSLELDATTEALIKDATVAAGVYPRAFAQEAVTADEPTLAWALFY